MKPASNPFAVTAAVDFSDSEVLRKWVPFTGQGAVADIAKPDSAMSMIIIGGKGSGKTHLMRFMSTAARLAGGDSPERLRENGYVGIYLRCGGINSERFSGKGQTDEAWDAVFRFYLDLTLAQLALRDAELALTDAPVAAAEQEAVCEAVIELFDRWDGPRSSTLSELAAALSTLRRAVDIEVSNCALSKRLDVTVLASASRLVFGVPGALSRGVSRLSGLRFVYLIDELENLSESQQVYVNSLVRETAPPTAIKVGARLYGLRTLRTLSAGEELKEGSEYERLALDDYLRSIGEPKFRKFAAQLCAQRLRESGLQGPASGETPEAWLGRQFEERPSSPLGDAETDFVRGTDANDRPWMERLRRHLERAHHRLGEEDITRVVSLLAMPNHPLVERVAVHAFYQEWFKAGPSVDAASSIAEGAADLVAGGRGGRGFRQTFSHWRGDMLAHVARDYQRTVVFAGFENLVRLSHGLPRHLLVILKHIYGWALFRGERPFNGGRISVDSQRLGIVDAAEWFFHDARMAGPAGESLQTTVSRIAELMRAIRFSDKPSEVGLCAFSVDWTSLSETARESLTLAQKWSLIGSIDGGRPDRNSSRVDVKFRLNPLLSVRWDLSISVRGDLPLSASDLDTVVTGDRAAFDQLVSRRTAGMKGPNFGRRKQVKRADISLFPDLE